MPTLPSLYPTGTKVALTICAVDEKTGEPIGGDSQPYKLVINPASFSHDRTIDYNTKPSLGQTSNPVKFSAMNPYTVRFSLVFDGTGVITAGLLDSPISVPDQIEGLSHVIYQFDGEKHQPNHVRLLWGTTIFYGRLTSFSTQYTLFKPSGEPLRAKSDLVFIGYVGTQEAALKANRSSPDLSHSVVVRDGDTLPLLCKRIYGDSRYYTAVARFNGLREFRQLRPGLRLHFPPLGG
jgi:phage tail protein X